MVTFHDYMESALYSKSGYYESRVPTADFYTAAELHGCFAAILTLEIVRRLDALESRKVPGPYFIVEMGSGNGALGSQVLRCLRERHGDWAAKIRYVFVERSESQLLSSILSAASSERVLGYNRLRDVPPCVGVFLSNELVDAFAVHLLEKQGGKMREVYVSTSGARGTGIRGGEGVRAELGEISRSELLPIAARVCPQLPEGGRHAVNLEALEWVRQLGETIIAGTVITIDYGKRFAPQDPNPPRAFYRHRTGHSLFAKPGRQDLTASVDFDALIAEGERSGLRLDSYTTLSRFLLDRGIMEWMPKGEGLEEYKEKNKIKTLLHPDGMGEAYKVLIQEKIG